MLKQINLSRHLGKRAVDIDHLQLQNGRVYAMRPQRLGQNHFHENGRRFG